MRSALKILSFQNKNSNNKYKAPRDRLIFIMDTPILGKQYLYCFSIPREEISLMYSITV